jgi:coatomer subunit beta'
MTAWDLKAAEDMWWKSKDLGSLLLYYSASGDPDGLRKLAEKAKVCCSF